jgi:nucleotide-binding universal stress UspA family protein
MPTILVPVDDSANALRAIDYLVIQHSGRRAPYVHLLNVQRPLTGDIGRFLDHEQILSLHRDRGFKVLDAAREKLDLAGIPYAVHIGVGEPAEIILDYAREKGCDEIVMGAHGHGVIATLLMGSVAAGVSARAGIPVHLVE